MTSDMKNENNCVSLFFEQSYTERTLVKYYNDLLVRQSFVRGKDEVTYFYVYF